MALNWAKALQTAGGGIKEGGMLIGGMMYDTEQKREARLAATQAATLDAAQKAYKASYDNAYAVYKTLKGHRWKPVTGGTAGADSELQALMGEGTIDWTDLDSEIERAWNDVEIARKDFFRSVGIQYTRKAQPKLTDVNQKDPLGFTIAQQVEMGLADMEGQFGAIERGAQSVRGGGQPDVSGMIDRINQARIARAETMVEGDLTEDDKAAARLSGAALLEVQEGLRASLVDLQKASWPSRTYNSDVMSGLAQAREDEAGLAAEANAALQAAGMDTGVYDLTIPDPALQPGPDFDIPQTFVPGAADEAVAADENWAIQIAQQGTQGMIYQVASYDEAWGQFASILQSLLAEFGPDVAMQRYTEITGGVPPGSEAARAAQEVLAQFQRQGLQGIQ